MTIQFKETSYKGGYPRMTARTQKCAADLSHAWFKGNVPLTDSRFIMTEHILEGADIQCFSLKIHPFRLEDAGIYVFKLTNNAQEAKELYFQVEHSRLMELLKENRRYEIGSSNDFHMTSTTKSLDLLSNCSECDNSAICHEVQQHSHGLLIPSKKIAACSPSTLPATQQVAPQIATVDSQSDSHENSEFLSVFECPVCLEYMLPPYLQCNSGHLVCGNCRPKLQCCPTCRGPIPNVRNLGLEKIANTIRFPCKFASSGCGLVFYHQEKVEHEESCEYRPYSCPCPGASCKWQGALPDVMDHLKKVHKSITTLQGEDIVFLATDINLPGAVDWVMMQSCFGYNFMLVLEKQDRDQGQQMFYAVVQLIGAKKEAELFMYRLELSTMRRRLAWEATPRSIHEGVAHAIQQSDCLAFDTSTAQLFAENGNLGINVTISMAATDSLMLSSSR